jgi:hypothetical protein
MDMLRLSLRNLDKIIWVAFVVVCALPRVGRTDDSPAASPLVELRQAGEALADVEPDSVRTQRPELLLQSGVKDSAVSVQLAAQQVVASEQPAPRNFRSEIKEAIRGAVHEEIAREAMGRPVLPGSVASGKGNPKDSDSAENGRGDAANSKSAALQSQLARHNQAVSQAKSQGKSAINEKLQLHPGNGVPGRGQALH